jgi:hypothetical protein
LLAGLAALPRRRSGALRVAGIASGIVAANWLVAYSVFAYIYDQI